MLEMNLEGKVALVTGGNKGIGRSIALYLGRAGCRVAISGRSQEALAETHAALSDEGIDALALTADMSRTEDARALPERVAGHFGGCDILVNNAGCSDPMPALDITEESWNRVLDTNLRGYFFCAQAAARLMKEKGWGSIINMGSVQSDVAARNQAAYDASKGGIRMLTKVMALEWAEYGIRVNTVAPGSIRTNINRKYLADEANLNRNLSKICLGRIGHPDEVAGMAVFLCTEYASYITGTMIFVDGGWTIE
jgi:NAD(P)-dependent dehydrogenase (short-subunit alcohol dehydrogenase family)